MSDDKALDPAVQKVIDSYEAVLASFMDGLSTSMGRYNELLHKALPHNPKARYYYYTPGDEEKKGDSNDNKAAEEMMAGAAAIAQAEKKKEAAAPTIDVAAAEKSGEKQPKKPSSPLLRRPQLDEAELAREKDEARQELMLRRQSSATFAESPKTVKAKPHTAEEKKAVKEAAKKKDKTDKDKEGKDKEEGGEPKKPKEKKEKKEKSEATPAKKEGEEKGDDDEDQWEDVEDEEDEEGEEVDLEELFERIAPDPMLLKQLRVIKKEAKDLIFVLEQIHDWIALNIPTMGEEADSNVGIMAAMIESLEGLTEGIREIYDMESDYLEARAALEISFTRSPEIEASMQLIQCLDNDQWDSIEQGYRTLMRSHLLMHSQLSKNMEKLRNPMGRKRHNFSM